MTVKRVVPVQVAGQQAVSQPHNGGGALLVTCNNMVLAIDGSGTVTATYDASATYQLCEIATVGTEIIVLARF